MYDELEHIQEAFRTQLQHETPAGDSGESGNSGRDNKQVSNNSRIRARRKSFHAILDR